MTGYRVKVEAILSPAEIRAQLAGMKNLKVTVVTDSKFVTTTQQGTNALGQQLTAVTKVKNEVKDFAGKTKVLTDNTKGFGATLLHNAKAAATWAIAMGVLYGTLRKVEEGVQFVYDLDNQMNNIQMITQGTNEETKALARTYNTLASQLSSNTLDVARNAEEWLRQGRTVADTNTLIKASMVLSKVGMIDAAESASLLTSAINGYGLSASEAMAVVDKMSAIDVVAATSTKDLAIAMQQTAASGKLAGVSLDELYSYIAVVSDVTQQSAETIGNSFKTIFARINQVKIGSLVDEEDGSDLSNVDRVLKQYDINLRNAQGTFRETGDVLDELAIKWQTLNSMQQSEIAGTIAGKQSNAGIYSDV